jgi:hypothetical protein
MHCLIIVKTTWQEEMLCITIITGNSRQQGNCFALAYHCYNYTVNGNTLYLSHHF